ncbi:MAG: nicotinate-nucleotide adenylyltransferase [Clostridia bacterium]|nr:nicotinate-nucleotide adenylyltransferase [Clostridia bacterium]
MKTGILGGTFNPVHYGHLEMARLAKETFDLDRVLLVCTANPPHKQPSGHVSPQVRYEMLCAAMSPAYEGIYPCDIELCRGGVSYTSDTIAQLKHDFPHDDFYLILGSDMLESFPSWHEPLEITKNAQIIAVRRPNCEQDAEYSYAVNMIRESLSGTVYEAEFFVPPISSTEIRKRVYEAEPILGYLPYEVEKIIYKRALYSPADVHYITLDMQKRLNPKRFAHSISTMREAILLADRYGADKKKCRIAALTHDCEKAAGTDLVNAAYRCGLTPDAYELESPALIHAKLGAHMIRMRYGIKDKEIIDAVAVHTLAAPFMSKVAMVTYLADCIEPQRSYPDTDAIRHAASISLKEGMLTAIDLSEKFLVGVGKRLHPQTLAAREWLQTLEF